MANAFGDSIEAVLKLDASKFDTGISKAIKSLDQFKTSSTSVERLNTALVEVIDSLERLNGVSRRNIELFNSLGNAIHKMGLGLKLLQDESIDVDEAVNTMNNIFKAFQGTLSSVTLKLENVRSAEKQVEEATRSKIEAQREAIATLNANRESVMGLITGNNQLSASEKQATSSIERNSVAKQKDVASTNQLTSATNRLKSAMNSLKMVGTMVGSMLAYNFAHKLLVATGETIHAKSEMEGYFKMLRFSQSDIDGFNQALDKTVQQFQRVNKYSLGETISSIGVEFNLSTKEMEKAMKVTSMITSEYLRAGRNANEASLAVKDVLQGQFQRLSRETGVKGEQLKEAGWSGDTTDVLGLMEALEKVGESRNWDVFAEKANSLNDILIISQNRFGEWSADLVNVVQPAILNVFNSFMSFSQGVAESLTAFWEWLNTDGWGQTAVKIGSVGTALLTVTQAFTMYRTGMGMVEIANMGVSKTIASVVLGLKGQEVAEIGVRNAILSKILGVKAETLAESGVTNAIQSKLVALKEDSIQQTINATKEKLSTLALEENTLQTQINTLQQDLNTASSQKLITAKEEETIQEEINTAQKKLNSIASMEQEATNTGLIASLYLLGTGEAIVTGETTALTIAWGVLNGVFMLSPLGWITAGILALGSAIFVLTGGLDDGWSKMQTFNETIEQGTDALKPYQDRVNDLQTQLDEAKVKYGENSDEVKNLQSKYDDAKASMDSFYESLQMGTKITNELKDATSQLSANLDAVTRKNYGSFGHSNEEIEEVTKQMNAMGYGWDKSYVALQKYNKMNENFDRDQKKAIPVLTEHGRGLLENAENLGKWNKAYGEYIEHSTKANVAEDWWTWAWESMYAGEAKKRSEMMVGFEGIETGIRDKWNSIWKSLTDEEGVKFFKGDIDKQIGEYINSLGDSFNVWADGFSKWINDGIEGAKQSLVDGINNFINNLPTYLSNLDLIGAIFDALLPDPVSASDGESSDHPSFMDDVSAIMGFDVVDWVNRFIADPLSTLGISVPTLDLSVLFNSLFGGSEGINLGEYLNSLFDVSGWISSFTTNLSGIVTSVTDTANTVMTSFDSMRNTVSTNITNIVTTATQGFQSAYNNARTSLTSMRDTTSQVVTAMVNAWNHMKDSILNCAKQIWDGVTKRFSEIGDTIKGFYQKIQNPSQWGSSGSASLKSGTPKPSTGRAVARTIRGGGFAGGRGSAPTGSMSISSLKKLLCPDGNCGTLFDGFRGSDVVDVSTFLALVDDGHGFGGWNFSSNHLSHIRTTTNKWDTGSPIINLLGGIATSTKFKVGEFEEGTPKISWDAFVSMAQAIFSAIPYRFYYDSSWKGSWLGALQAGACNCWDGAHALIAFANACGFGGDIVHGTWTDPDGTSYPHVWATINGHKMDTTAWQQRGSWSAGSPTVTARHTSKPVSNDNAPVVNVTINGDVYGVDDLESKIEDGIDKGLQKHFNPSYAVGV